MVFDLEGQVSQHVSSQSVAPRQGESLADTSNGFNAYEMAEVENHTNKAASKHMETQHVGQHGTSEYYQQLVKRALMDGKLDVHALSFDFLHRLVLLDHQKKLAGYFCEVVNDSTTTEAKLFEISKSLHEYTKATADYMFWRDKEKMLLDTDLNNMAAYQNSQLKSTSDTTLKELSELHKILIPEVKEIQGLKPDLIGVTRQVQNHKGQHQGDQSVGSASAAGIPNYLPYRWLGSEPDNKHQQQRESYNRSSSESTQVLNHLAMAIVGGVSLIVPMLIMALHRSRATSLVTTSVAVTLFAVLLAIWPVISKHFPWAKKKVDFADLDETLGNKEVLLATAAYAAVLVVFVGASLSTAV